MAVNIQRLQIALFFTPGRLKRDQVVVVEVTLDQVVNTDMEDDEQAG